MSAEGRLPWPPGVQAAVSFTYDDGRASQLDLAVPLFDEYDIKATFFLSPPNAQQELERWKGAAASGHELGNHTFTHPCSANFPWMGADNSLENMNADDMRVNLTRASLFMREELGVEPRTFAYPCYQTHLGRGKDRQSYVPIVADMFLAGRGGQNESMAGPAVVDLAHVPSIDSDARTLEYLRPWIDEAAEQGRWLVFSGHDLAPEAKRQCISVEELRRTIEYALDRRNIRIDTFGGIAALIAATL